MAMKIRLARAGAKKRPYYRIVATDGRMPRDGRFIEKLGTYNPLLPKTDEKRVVINSERVLYWLSQGAQPSDRVARFLEAKEILSPKTRNNPEKAKAGEKALARLAEKEEKMKEAAEQAASAEESAPAPETAEESAPAPETAEESAPAPEAAEESAPAPEAAEESAPAPEAAEESAPAPETAEESAPSPAPEEKA